MREAPREWKCAIIEVFNRRKGLSGSNNYREVSLVAHAVKVLVKIVASCLET